MKVIVGLGNPGKEYEGTRHNAGFISIDAIAQCVGVNYWKTECGAEVAHIKDSFLLVKPQSYMNLSGGPVKNVLDKYKLSITDLIVIHDDMDISSGSIRVKRGGSSAGHNGIKSICNKLQSQNFIRVRIGIDKAPGRKPVVDYVLEAPKGNQAQQFISACNTAADAALFLLENSLESAQQKFNSKNQN